MPRNVRNFWIEGRVDGRSSQIATGPIRSDGGFSLSVLVIDGRIILDVEANQTLHVRTETIPNITYVEIRDKAKELATTFGIDAAAAPKWGG